MAVKLYRGDTWTRAWQLTDASGFIADTAYGITYLFVNSVELPLPATAPYPQNNAPGWLIPAIYMNE